jgi:hypothetical protein
MTDDAPRKRRATSASAITDAGRKRELTMIPFRHDYDSSYLEKVERQAQIARAERLAHVADEAYQVAKAGVRAVARLFKPAHHDGAGQRAA